MLELSRIWRDLDAEISRKTPQFSDLLNPPANETEVQAIEHHIGMKLPPSVRDSYLIHNGESDKSDGLFDVWNFLPLHGVKMWWDEMKLIEEAEQFGDFDVTAMIPIMFMEGDLRYVDHSVDGCETPLVEWNHEDPTRDVKADSFARFLEDFLNDFRSGKMIAEPEFSLKAIVVAPHAS